MFLVVDNPDFVEWLENEMKQRGIIPAELARRGGITRSAVSKLLSRQQKRPGIEMLDAIARALDMPKEIIYQKVGYLPAEQKVSPLSSAILFLIEQLPIDDQEEMLDYARMKLERRKNKNAQPQGTGRDRSESQPE
jgi:transcriptional regulator with XRE-family HTH domain